MICSSTCTICEWFKFQGGFVWWIFSALRSKASKRNIIPFKVKALLELIVKDLYVDGKRPHFAWFKAKKRGQSSARLVGWYINVVVRWASARSIPPRKVATARRLLRLRGHLQAEGMGSERDSYWKTNETTQERSTAKPEEVDSMSWVG